MRIEIGAAFQAYQRNQVKQAAKSAPQAAQKLAEAVNTDTLSLSGNVKGETPIAKQTKNIAFQLEAEGSAAKLERLSAAIARNEYFVPTKTLVDSILGGEG